MSTPSSRQSDAGFTLLEVMMAMMLLLVGVLAMAGAVAVSARRLTASQDQFQASQRAAEAVESVFKARDNQVLTWSQIHNKFGASGHDGGIFQDGPQDVRDPGPDGLVNTDDDGAVAVIVKPGPDGLLGTADDVRTALYGFTREIKITDISATLRQLQVIVRYQSANGPAQYVLTTYISQYA